MRQLNKYETKLPTGSSLGGEVNLSREFLRGCGGKSKKGKERGAAGAKQQKERKHKKTNGRPPPPSFAAASSISFCMESFAIQANANFGSSMELDLRTVVEISDLSSRLNTLMNLQGSWGRLSSTSPDLRWLDFFFSMLSP